MARYRDYFYADHDIEVNLDGTAGMQLQASVVTDAMAESTDYWLFWNQQAGKDNNSSAVPTVQYLIDGQFGVELKKWGNSETYFSFAFMLDLEPVYAGSTGMTLQNYVGGTT